MATCLGFIFKWDTSDDSCWVQPETIALTGFTLWSCHLPNLLIKQCMLNQHVFRFQQFESQKIVTQDDTWHFQCTCSLFDLACLCREKLQWLPLYWTNLHSVTICSTMQPFFLCWPSCILHFIIAWGCKSRHDRWHCIFALLCNEYNVWWIISPLKCATTKISREGTSCFLVSRMALKEQAGSKFIAIVWDGTRETLEQRVRCRNAGLGVTQCDSKQIWMI